MILTDDELQHVRQAIEAQAYLDDELARRCGHLLRIGAFDEAVRAAFVLLEERLRATLNEDAMTGTRLANKAFNPSDGPLARHLGRNQSEREGLREFFSGAFKLFRNPSAHGAIGYDASDGKAIVGMVNLMLRFLKSAAELPPAGILPGNVELVLGEAEQAIGPAAASRLRAFLVKCLKAGLKPSVTPKQWIPFRRHAFVKFDRWDAPKSHIMAVFYLTGQGVGNTLHFPTHSYYSNVVGFNVDRLVTNGATFTN